jgi:hypothetical protein
MADTPHSDGHRLFGWPIPGNGRRLALATAGLLALPLLFSYVIETCGVAVPRVFSGDEPHYLVQLSSVVRDGDLDLRNNYEAVWGGADQAGRRFAGHALDAHVVWYVDGAPHPFYALFKTEPSEFGRDASGRRVPTPRPGVTVDVSGRPAYSSHPPGLALLLAPVLLPLRGTAWLEPAALVCSWLAVLGALLFFRQLVRGLGGDRPLLDAVAALAFLGTPAWHYARTLFTEPYLLLFMTGAYALFLCRGWSLVPGCFVGAGMLMKPPFAVVAGPLLTSLAVRGRVRAAIWMTLPLLVAAAAVLLLNRHLFGSPFHSSQQFQIGNPLFGLVGLLLSPQHGLVPFAPAVLLALAGWPELARRHRHHALVLGGGCLAYLALMSLWGQWPGGYCFGPRLILPVIPLLHLGCVPAAESRALSTPTRRRAVARGLVGLSLLINALGAVPNWVFWSRHPLFPFIER